MNIQNNHNHYPLRFSGDYVPIVSTVKSLVHFCKTCNSCGPARLVANRQHMYTLPTDSTKQITKRNIVRSVPVLGNISLFLYDLNYSRKTNQLYQHALHYHEGVVEIKNETRAFSLFKQAADRGHALAMRVTSEMYREGLGVARKLDQYEKLLQAANPYQHRLLRVV